MKRSSLTVRMVSGFLAFSVLAASCVSSTVIKSNPDNAKIYIDGVPVGTTPYIHIDTKIIGSSTTVRLEKDGYKPINTYFTRTEQVDAGAIIGGLFCCVPFLWTMKYNPIHYYEMVPLSPKVSSSSVIQDDDIAKLKEYKKMLDEGLISPADYEKAKAKVLGD